MRITADHIRKLSKTPTGRKLLTRMGVDPAIYKASKGNKYRNRPVHVVMLPDGGHTVVEDMAAVVEARRGGQDAFKIDSELEYGHWKLFQQMRAIGVLVHYERNRRFVLQEAFKHPTTGAVQRAINYYADHYFERADLEKGVCDSKGRRTREYINKAKTFIRRYGHDVVMYEWTKDALTVADFGQKFGKKGIGRPKKSQGDP